MQQILAFELILKLTAGLMLLALPATSAKIFGIADDQFGLWPRLLGAVLVGLGGGIYLEIAKLDGVSIRACLLINVVSCATIVTVLALNRGAATWRGRTTLGVISVLLAGLCMIEISYILAR